MKITHFFLMLGLLICALGCGGGGGTSGGSTNNGGGALFITDSLDDRAHVWVTIQNVTLTGTNGTTVLYNDATGVTVDLKRLRDNNGQLYKFIGRLPAGTYTGVSFTLDDTLTIYQNGSNAGQTRTFAGATNGRTTFNLTFVSPRVISQNGTLAIDFDLQSWDDNGTTVSAISFIKESDGQGLANPGRHVDEDYHGVVRNLSGIAPNQTFTLNRGINSFTVITNSQTVIYNRTAAVNPTLTNNRPVEVRGTFSTSDNALIATSIKIEDGNGGSGGEAEIEGNVNSIDVESGTFILTGIDFNFQPANTTVNIVTTGSTRYFTRRGVAISQAQFFANLLVNSSVEVEGSYDSASNTLTATKVKFEDGENGLGQAEVKGPAANVIAGTGTLDITAREWQGMNIGFGTVVHVTTNINTRFRVGSENVSQAQFFAALTSTSQVKAEGPYDTSSQTMAATEVRIVTSGGGGN